MWHKLWFSDHMALLNDSKHLSLIDAGISNVWSLSLPEYLESLNLHGNCIQNITNLTHLRRLVHLNLSANQISVIDGLDTLQLLKTLNLSCNQISVVDGLSSLRWGSDPLKNCHLTVKKYCQNFSFFSKKIAKNVY